MNQLTMVVMCGISGSGKSTWAKTYAQNNDLLYISSDELRLRLFADESDQSHNPEVFLEMHRIADQALAVGQSVILDACNLSAKRRASLVKSFKTKFPGLVCHCVTVNTAVKDCYERNGQRSRVVPLYVVARQLTQFTLPSTWEGWDKLSIIKDENLDYNAEYTRILQAMKDFGDQKNPHHHLTLYDHCVKCQQLAYELFPKRAKGLYDAALLHDCGKIYTQTIDENGIAHYFGHQNYGAYLAMNCNFDEYWISVINYHMTCFHKQEGRVWKERLGKRMWKDIKRLHECDVAAQE